MQTRSRKIWLDSYPPGVPPEVDVRAFPSLKDMFERSFARFRDKPAFTNMGVAVTFDAVDRLSRDFGAYLQKVVGLPRGERVAIMLPNLLQSPVALFGALRAGMTVVNVNPLYTPSELAHQLADSGATTDAMPFLKAAKQVVVSPVKPDRAAHGDAPGTDIGLYLTRHGVRVEVAAIEGTDLDAGNALLSRAADLSIDLIVTGAYGHSRVSELILGGVTRTMLESMTVPVLMSH